MKGARVQYFLLELSDGRHQSINFGKRDLYLFRPDKSFFHHSPSPIMHPSVFKTLEAQDFEPGCDHGTASLF